MMGKWDDTATNPLITNTIWFPGIGTSTFGFNLCVHKQHCERLPGEEEKEGTTHHNDERNIGTHSVFERHYKKRWQLYSPVFQKAGLDNKREIRNKIILESTTLQRVFSPNGNFVETLFPPVS